jgi:hypothetical protein
MTTEAQWRYDRFTWPEMKDVTAPNLPGHGVQFDWDGLEQHRIC